MKKILSLLTSIIYIVGTSSMFHVFAMYHIHSHTTTDIDSTIGMHHSTANHSNFIVTCGDNSGCLQICSLIEGSKVTITPSNLSFDLINHYSYISLSVFLPPVEIIAIKKPFENFTIHKPQFSSSIVGVIKLTI